MEKIPSTRPDCASTVTSLPTELPKNRGSITVIVTTCIFAFGAYLARGPGSVVGIVNGYGAGRSRDRSTVGARFSAPVQIGPEAHPAFCTTVTGSFPGIKSGRGVTLTPHPLYCRGEGRVELYLYFPMGRTDCTEPRCLYRGVLYFTFTYLNP